MWGYQTAIVGVVLPEKNQSIASLVNNSLVLIVKNDGNHDDIHQLQLKIDQSSFPIHFNITNIKEITNTGTHLLTLLIFGFTHRLLWESVLVQQSLIVNQANHITFIVKDVCKWYLNIIIYHPSFSILYTQRICESAWKKDIHVQKHRMYPISWFRCVVVILNANAQSHNSLLVGDILQAKS